jgi:hypothetical protein
MTARCYPARPDFEHVSERVVWQAVRDQLSDEAVVFANRRFTDRRGDHEADLIVGIPGAGIAVIEVKGGHVTHDGMTWRQSGGGADNKPIKPQVQGRRVKYALRSHRPRRDGALRLLGGSAPDADSNG